jgi:DNA topoisomerase-1
VARAKKVHKALVVVESPAKARTIKKYLGSGYEVKACIGHVKDLPKAKISVDIENGFLPHYEVIRGKRKVLNEIKAAAKKADVVYLAPDPDREGEAIAVHIHEELGKKEQQKTQRITFNEITKRAIQEAIAAPRAIDTKLFESQQARRILDRLVGYQISPILWDKVRRGLSAGRVQSVAVRLIVEREAEIRAFKPEEYWSILCDVEGPSPPPFEAKVATERGHKFRPDNGADAHRAAEALRHASFRVAEVGRRERRRRPNAPLITSKLQQEAAGRLRFTAKRTMVIAQQLYEGVDIGDEGSVGLITYMRTDSTRVSNDALAAVRDYIGRVHGPAFVPAAAHVYKNKKSAQEAHEAIRPTSLELPPERVKPFLTREQFLLYELIWQAFVASQMEPAVFDQTTVDIEAGDFALRVTGSILKFRGFLAVWPMKEDSDQTLPELHQGDSLACHAVRPNQHFTQPPPRFSEATLVKELEDRGIGRPSTYAAILSTIVTRGYVEKVEGRFHPSELGQLVTELLTESFPTVLDVEFTAQMESQLDSIETGEANWVETLSGFYHGGFAKALEKAASEMRDVKRMEIETPHRCESCGEGMVIKWGRNGSFLACKGYPKCRNTRDYKRLPDGTLEILPEATTDQRCPTCGGEMAVKRGRFGQFLACRAYPECKGTRPMSIGVDCPQKCGGYLSERRSHRGRVFYGCSTWPGCNFVSWNRPVGEACPDCGGAYLIRKYSKKDGARITCPNKECHYVRDPELTDEDAALAAQ